MNEKFNKNAKVEQLANMFLNRGEEKGLIVKDPLRNTFDFEVPNYRLQSTLNSYFPSTIRLWNNLEQDLRHNFTQKQFKFILKF